MKILTPFVFLLLTLQLTAQTNILSTNSLAEEIMLGNYIVDDYLPATVINHPEDIIPGINAEISPDSLKAYIIRMAGFQTRHTSSDTTSQTTGIGAARRWVYAKFEEFSSQSENRLIPSYLQFDQNIFGMGQHRNIFAVLPGIDPAKEEIIIIEGHLDSRCKDNDDTECIAQGVEDNASGSALVMELARVMSKYSFSNTIVFMTTIGEEQGLYGANAFAEYTVQKGIKVKIVLNNDVIGGIICGQTSSPPSCPGFNEVDSTQVRLFSAGAVNSAHKSLARYSKLQYVEELLPIVSVPMMVSIMSPEDRTGRGGDHIPFRERGITAIRYTAANEHGDAGAQDPDYHDRQHTSDDILGVDTDGDLVIDSFFVDFNYLARNAVINGVTAANVANGPASVAYTMVNDESVLTFTVDDPNNYDNYRLGVRRFANDFDTLINFTETELVYVPELVGPYYFSICSVDSNSVESLFSEEEFLILGSVGTSEAETEEGKPAIELLQNRPNPFDEATFIVFNVNEEVPYRKAEVVISDLNGKVIRRIDTQIRKGINEVLYRHGYNMVGTFVYSLFVDGELVGSKKMVFAN